jgi:2-amino-1-hydroxyethylphosphonate dioxygenase (glycine-forming)
MIHKFTSDLLSIYKEYGNDDYIGEPISQQSHMLQAAYFAQQAGADDELILAAFFHDIGHLCAPFDAEEMDGLGIVDHEQIGAQYLSTKGCSARLCQLVASHVQAKRYLCWKNPAYFAKLSQASTGTLAFQGGPMSTEEALSFEASPMHKDILRLRVWDEQAKIPQGPELDWELLTNILNDHICKTGNYDNP